MLNGRYVLYAADASGTAWDVTGFDTRAEAEAAWEVARRSRPDRAHGVYDSQNPEAGDMEE